MPTDRIERSLALRRRRDPLRFFAPANEAQAAALANAADPRWQGTFAIGGNQSGKTTLGAVATIRRVLGLGGAPPAARSWCCSQHLPGGDRKEHLQLETLRRWAPSEALRGGSWERAYAIGPKTLTWAQGQRTVFKGYDQGPLAFESAALDWIWFDEEPPDRTIYTSCLMRLARRRGRWMMTATPVLSLLAQGWIEDLWEERHEAEERGDYHTFQLFTSANPWIPPEELERLLRLPEEERQVRLYGAFARLGGRVLSEFDPSQDLVPDFLPPREWRHYLIIDPGWHKTGHLWAAVDREGDVWVHGEHYQGEWRPAQHMIVAHGMWEAFGRPEVDARMDPAGFALKRTTTGHELPSDVEEYRVAAEELGATWFQPRRADNSDPYAWRLKRYLGANRWKVCRGCRWWQWEAERWTREKERRGPAAVERPVPDKPIDRHNHLMACSRYLANLLPEPIPAPEPPRPRTPERIVEQHLERILKRRQRGRRRRDI